MKLSIQQLQRISLLLVFFYLSASFFHIYNLKPELQDYKHGKPAVEQTIVVSYFPHCLSTAPDFNFSQLPTFQALSQPKQGEKLKNNFNGFFLSPVQKSIQPLPYKSIEVFNRILRI